MKIFDKPWKIYLWIFFFFLALHAFIFRDILFHLPQLLNGTETIVREELIPFFNWDTQFFSQMNGGLSSLTSGSEVRIAYSFLTSWVRHFQILPFALVLLNTVSAFLLFYSFFTFARTYFRKNKSVTVQHLSLFSFLASFPIYSILLYSKITHFYTLIIGFSLFSVALVWYMIEIMYRDKISWGKLLLISLLILVNPAIHYHLLFYIAAFIISFMAIVLHRLRENKRGLFRRISTYFFSTTLLSAIPYGIYIMSTTGDDVTGTIPAVHYLIQGASIYLTHLISMDSSSQVDMFLYGLYIPLDTRWLKLLYIVAILIGMFYTRKLQKQKKPVLFSLLILTLFSFWMALGYREPFSFHHLLRDVAVFLASVPNVITTFILKLFYIVIEVLRLPNRFQLIAYCSIGLLLTVMATQLFLFWKKRWKKHVSWLFVLFGVAFLFPIVGTAEYRDTFLSGNFHDFIKPWPIHQELNHIKSILHQANDGRLLILPTMESGRITGDEMDGYNNYIDKFYIYYLDYPTLYYGSSSELRNKLTMQLVYRSILYNQDWWNNIITNLPDVKYILVNKDISYRPVGLVYIPQLERSLYSQIQKSPYLEILFEGKSYDLYRISPPIIQGKGQTVVDVRWTNFLRVALQTPKEILNTIDLIPINLRDVNRPTFHTIITDNPKKTALDLFALLSPDHFYRPDPYLLPFVSDIIPSTIYTNTMVAMSALYGTNNFFRRPVPAIYQPLTGQFLALKPSDSVISIPLTIIAGQDYNLLLRQFNNGSTIKITLKKGDTIVSHGSFYGFDQDTMVSSFSYTSLYQGYLEAGDYIVDIVNDGNELVFVDGLLVVQKQEVPFVFKDGPAELTFEVPGAKYVFSVKTQEGIPVDLIPIELNILMRRQ